MRFAPGSVFSIAVGGLGTSAESCFSFIAFKFQDSFHKRRNVRGGLLAVGTSDLGFPLVEQRVAF